MSEAAAASARTLRDVLAAHLRDAADAIVVVSVDVDAPGADDAGGADGGRGAPDALQDLPPLGGDTPALLMYTSGTTGTPKGALLRHANLVAAGRAVAGWHGLTAADRCLSSLPLYHINGQCIATITPFVSGGSVVAPHRFSASAWWPLVEEYRPTWLIMVPPLIAYLINGATP